MTTIVTLNTSTMYFPPPLTRSITNVISALNSSDQILAYKIKTTAPKRYTVKPRMGVLEPHERVDINITMHGSKDITNPESIDDKFLVETAYITSEEHKTEITKLWEELGKDRIIKQKLKCKYVTNVPNSVRVVLHSDGNVTVQFQPISSTSLYQKPKQSENLESSINFSEDDVVKQQKLQRSLNLSTPRSTLGDESPRVFETSTVTENNKKQIPEDNSVYEKSIDLTNIDEDDNSNNNNNNNETTNKEINTANENENQPSTQTPIVKSEPEQQTQTETKPEEKQTEPQRIEETKQPEPVQTQIQPELTQPNIKNETEIKQIQTVQEKSPTVVNTTVSNKSTEQIKNEPIIATSPIPSQIKDEVDEMRNSLSAKEKSRKNAEEQLRLADQQELKNLREKYAQLLEQLQTAHNKTKNLESNLRDVTSERDRLQQRVTELTAQAQEGLRNRGKSEKNDNEVTKSPVNSSPSVQQKANAEFSLMHMVIAILITFLITKILF